MDCSTVVVSYMVFDFIVKNSVLRPGDLTNWKNKTKIVEALQLSLTTERKLLNYQPRCLFIQRQYALKLI